MNFNPMDLILVKEHFYDIKEDEYDTIGNFISTLIDLQAHGIPEKLREKMHNNGKYFDWKQELIDLALKGGAL